MPTIKRRLPPYLYKRGSMYYSRIRDGKATIREPLDTDVVEASRKVMEMVEERNAGRLGRESRKVSWERAKAKYFSWADTEKMDSTVSHERSGIAALEALHIPGTPREVTPARLDELKAKLIGEGAQRPKVNRLIRAVKVMMRKLEAWKMAPAQNWRTVSKLKEPRKRKKAPFWPLPEWKVVLKHSHGMYETAYRLGGQAGLRPGESRHLQPKDAELDPGRGQIHIVGKDCSDCRSCRKRGNRWDPKDFEERIIPIKEPLRAHLAARRREVKKWWVEHDGYRPSEAVFAAYMAKIVRRAKLKGTAHKARHTYASHLAEKGVPLDRIRDLLGHSSIQQCEVYAHLQPSTLLDAVSLLPDV